jgi:hypothetical protein
MYRAPHDTFVSTIERLERELRELRALRARPRPRERLLWALTTASLLGAVLAGAGLAAARTHALDAERRFDGARVRLEQKTTDLQTCEDLAFHALSTDRD